MKKNSLSVAKLNMRTTSSLESFHRVLNQSIETHSTFFKFVTRLRLHESHKTDGMNDLAHNVLSNSHYERRKQRDRERELKIQFYSAKLFSGQFTVSQFLLAMAADENGLWSPKYFAVKIITKISLFQLIYWIVTMMNGYMTQMIEKFI